jgi:hypothetical protein
VNKPRDYRFALIVTRYVLPSVLVLAGLILLAIHPRGALAEGALGIIGAGLAAFLFAFLAKVSMSGDKFRDREEAARRYLDEHGHWPDEQ